MVYPPPPPPYGPPPGYPPGYPQTPYIPAQAAPPGALRPTGIVDSRLKTLGTLCIVLAGCQLAYFLYTLASSAFSVIAVSSLRAFVGGKVGPVPPEATKLADSMESLMWMTALGTILRMVPYALLSGVLIWIGARINRGDRSALETAKTWMWWALGAVALSLAVQAGIIIPATIEFQAAMKKGVLSGLPKSSSSVDFESFSIAVSVVTMLAGAVTMAAWPIILRFWSDKLLEQTAQPLA